MVTELASEREKGSARCEFGRSGMAHGCYHLGGGGMGCQRVRRGIPKESYPDAAAHLSSQL